MPNSNSKTHPTPTMNRNRNEGQRELFSGSLRQAEGAENDRTFELSFSSEEPYTRWFGPEILDHSDGCVDMSRLTEIGVVLFNHDRDQVIGKIKSARIEGNRGLATVEFDDDPESERIAAKVRSGTLKGVSVGYQVSNWEDVDKGKKSLDGRFTGPCSIAKRWMPHEVSISLTLSDMNDKTAAEKLQGYWIHEIGEMAGMRKADLEKVKAFVSRCDDKYRASFGRRVTPHPRQCIFFGTTNSENGYLRDITGNRRFWNVRVPGTGRMKPWDLTQEIIDQIWAEVIVLAKGGEELFLSHELEEYAKKEQSEAMERDDREGLVARYLDMLLPETWDTMDVYQRREYVQDPDSPLNVKGTVRRETVSNIEIWCECFGKAKEDIKPSDSYALAAIMTRFGDWERTAKSVRLPIYGKQRVYQRK